MGFSVLQRFQRLGSPFEQVVITLDIKLPIFVARQLVRHRTQSLNEVSGRYSVLPEEFYIPDAEQVCYQDANNKQGRAGPCEPSLAAAFLDNLRGDAGEAFLTYHEALENGLAKETARLGLPLNTYTHWCTTWDAHNLLHMLALRLDKHAQWEIRQYAEAIATIVKEWLPLTWEAFEDYRLHAVTLSRQEVDVVKHVFECYLIDGGSRSFISDMLKERGMSDREVREFMSRFAPGES